MVQGRQERNFANPWSIYFSHGFFVDGNNKFKRRKGRMKTLWIGMMAITFVLGTGMVAVMYILGKMVFSYAKSIA
jgi:hypothetical protein